MTRNGFLGALPPEVADALLARPARSFAVDAPLMTEGVSPGPVHLILEGRVKVVTQTASGRPVVLAVRGPGELIGELAALDGLARSASALPLVPTTAVSMPGEQFRELLLAYPAAALALLSTTAARLRDADLVRTQFTALDSAGRVAARLVELGEQHGERTPEGLLVDLGLTQDEIASWTGTSREALGRALTAFRTRGWISTERRRVVLLNVEALRKRGS